MNEIITKLEFYMGFPFVRYALIVGVLVALCSSLFGVILVLKRYSLIGDGLTHVAFGATAVATVLNLYGNMLVVMIATIITAIILLRGGQNSKLKGDAFLAMISVSSLAIGYLVLNVFSSSGNISGDVCTTLFGSTLILTLSEMDVYISIIISIIVISMFIIFYNKIMAVTFDEDFSKAIGIRTGFYNTLTAVLTAVIIVLAMNLAGSLLVSALVVFPALSSMRVFKNFKGVVISSGIISVCCGFFGIIFSILYSTPVGSTIVAANIVMFVIFTIIGKRKK